MEVVCLRKVFKFHEIFYLTKRKHYKAIVLYILNEENNENISETNKMIEQRMNKKKKERHLATY